MAARGCGPTVIPAFRGQVRFICKKLGMKAGDTGDSDEFLDQVAAAQKQTTKKELKQSDAWPMEAIGMMEKGVFAPVKVAFRIFMGFIAVLIYASLRFSDSVRVIPGHMKLYTEALMGKCWESKTCRNGKFMKWAVPNCSFTKNCPWLYEWFKLYNEQLDLLPPEVRQKVDFMMPAINKYGELDWTQAMEYKKAVALARTMLKMMVDASELNHTVEGARTLKMLEEFIDEFEGIHGLKASMPTLMVGVGENYAAKLQGHWAKLEGGMVERYARDKLAFPIAAVYRITQDAQKGVAITIIMNVFLIYDVINYES